MTYHNISYHSCNKCGIKIEERHQELWIYPKGKTHYSIVDGLATRFDLCKKCFKEIIKILNIKK